MPYAHRRISRAAAFASVLAGAALSSLAVVSCSNASSSCLLGRETCGCRSDGSCKSGLTCLSGLCVNASSLFGSGGGNQGTDISGSGGGDEGSGGSGSSPEDGSGGAGTAGDSGGAGTAGGSGSGSSSTGASGAGTAGGSGSGGSTSSSGTLSNDGGKGGGSSGTGGGSAASNLLTNGDFSDGESAWNLTKTGSPTDSVNASGQLCTTVGSDQAITIGWPREGTGALVLAAGVSYVLSYQASSTPAGYPLSVKVGMSTSPYTADFETASPDALGVSMQTFTHTFTSTSGDSSAGLAFFVTQPSTSTTVCFDNVVLSAQ